MVPIVPCFSFGGAKDTITSLARHFKYSFNHVKDLRGILNECIFPCDGKTRLIKVPCANEAAINIRLMQH